MFYFYVRICSLLALGFLGGTATAQQTRLALYVQNFNDTTQTAVSDLDASGALPQPIIGDNKWTINKRYGGAGLSVDTPDESNIAGGVIAGGPQSSYLHIANSASSAKNANWNPVSESNRFCILASDICMKGFSDAQLTFFWIGKGSPTAYGEFYFSYEGSAWEKATAVSGLSEFKGSGDEWRAETIKLPFCDDKQNVSIGFRWYNGVNAADVNTVSFGLDDIMFSAIPDDANITITIPEQPTPCRGGNIQVCIKQNRVLYPGIYIFEMAEKLSFGEPIFGLGSIAQIFDENFQQAMTAEPNGLCLTLPVPASLSTNAQHIWRARRVAIWDAGSGLYPGLPGSPELTSYLYGPAMTSPPSVTSFGVTDCREEVWTQGYTPGPPTTFKMESACDVACVNSIATVNFNSKYVFGPENQYKCELLKIEGADTTFVTYFGSPSPDENAYPYPGGPGSIGGIIPDVQDGCSYYFRVVTTDPPQDSVILHPWGPFCIRHCDIETNNLTPITVCLDCAIEKAEDVVTNANNVQPPPVYYVCDTCPVPAGLQAFNDTTQISPEYPWNPVQSACEGPGARIPVLVKINRWGNANGAPTYSPDTKLKIQLLNMGPEGDGAYSFFSSGVVGQTTVGNMNGDTLWIIIPKDINQTATNPPVGSWFMRIVAEHSNPIEAVDSVPGFDALHPDANCTLADTFGTTTTLTISRPNFKPVLQLYDRVTDCENKVSLLTINVSNDQPGRQYAWYVKNHITGLDSLLLMTPPDINAVIDLIEVGDSITIRARVWSPGCWGPFGDSYTFYATSGENPNFTASISGEIAPIVGDTVTYQVAMAPIAQGSWSLKQGYGQIIEQNATSITIYWNTASVDTLVYTPVVPFNTGLCWLVDSMVAFLPINISMGVERPDLILNAPLSVKLYPNPAKGSFTVEGPRNGTVEVFDALGRKRFETRLRDVEKIDCPAQDWPRGVYLVRFTAPNGRTQTISLSLTE